MPKKQKRQNSKTEADSTYFLKLVLYVVLGSLWLKFSMPLEIGSFVLTGIPLGLMVGLLFASHDHFQVDRKIEYAILIVMTVMSYFLPTGIVI
tara:strand:- start:281 stop:559 length:279 start_codon:yes stop_codon:yes gene_type:complete